MKPRIDLQASDASSFAPPSALAPITRLLSRSKSILLPAAGLIALALPMAAQQQYGYGSQYPAQSSPYGYTQPQYAQPQYQQAQPYTQPQYSQYPQQQPYAQQQYPQPQGYPQQQPYADQTQPYPQQPPEMADQTLMQEAAPVQQTQQPLGANDLEQLVAPIALYPDNLIAQILAASTYPAQVAVADQWLKSAQAQGYSSPDQIAAGANAQTDWDPSVKALTAFPQVLDMMNQNLQWTTALGNAYYNQPQDVMQTIQMLRQNAQQAGNLQTTPQEQVTDDQGYIEVAPANPEVVYVPMYNPWAVYGAPIVAYPGFGYYGYGQGYGYGFGLGAIRFGLGIAMAAFEHMPFGWLGWGLSWLGHGGIFFNHAAYSTHSTSVADWGLPHGGLRAFPGSHPLPGNRPLPYGGRTAGGYDTARGAYQRPGSAFAGGTRNDAIGRNYQSYTHPAMPGSVAGQQAYNRMPAQSYAARPQTYAGTGAYNYQSRPTPMYTTRPGMAYASPSQSYREPAFQSPAYRAPQMSEPMRSYSERSMPSYNQSFARNEGSGGFHLFGGEHASAPKNFGGEHFSAPKEHFSAPKSFGGGGHFSAPKAPKESHSGGGGHGRR